MGDFIGGVLGTNSSVDVNDPFKRLEPWQNGASTLADQLQKQSQGGGPNPAQSQYLQNAQQIAQQQANTYSANRALNPGLAARLAGNSAANVQQNAAAQAGTQQAQQQLASQNVLSNLYAEQEGQINKAQGISAGIGAGNQQQAGNITGGLIGGAGSAMMMMSRGGMVDNQKSGQVPDQSRFPGNGGFPGQSNYDDGGFVMPAFGSTLAKPINIPGLGVAGIQPTPISQGNYNLGELGGGGSSVKSKAGQFLSGLSSKMGSSGSDSMSAFNQFSRYMAKGGMVPAMVSPGEKYLNPKEAKEVASGKESVKKEGKKIPGKAEVSGDSLANDKVPAKLEEGGIVIPRSKMGSEEEAQKFVAKEMAKHMKSPEGEFHQALKRAVEKRKNK
jgi:hypothetical protein